METIETDVRGFIAENYLLGEDPASLPAASSLIEAGLIDSTGVLELIGFLEEHFGIRITDAELLPENLDSIENVVAFVGRKLDEATVEEGAA